MKCSQTIQRRFRAWRAWVFVLALALCALHAHAEPQERSTPSAVVLILVGQAQGEHSLFKRIRSLFEPDTRFAIDQRAELDRDAVLQPPIPDTLYVWISFDGRMRARVYVATREQNAGSPRYLYRDIELHGGLDEIGSETIAQVAHSSARALWVRDRETSRSVLISALDADEATQPSMQSEPTPASGEVNREPSRLARHTWVRLYPKAFSVPERTQLTAAASFASYASGGEGWLNQFGASLMATFWRQFSVRVAAAYLVPRHFDAPLTQIALTGASAEFRLGWKSPAAHGFRGHLEAGLGLFATTWSAAATPPASERPGASQRRIFTLGAIGCERSVGPLVLAARFELRIPTRDTTYEVVGGTNDLRAVHTWLNPGFAIEVGLPLEPFL